MEFDAADPVGRGGVPADERALPLQVGQDGGTVDTGRSAVEQIGGQARGPALHPGVQIRDGQTGQRHLLARERAGYFADGEGEFVLAERDELPVDPPPVQGSAGVPRQAGTSRTGAPLVRTTCASSASASGPATSLQSSTTVARGDVYLSIPASRAGPSAGSAVAARLGQDRCTGGDRGRKPVPESGPAATGQPRRHGPAGGVSTTRDQSGRGRAPPISGCRHTSHATNATLTAVTATRMVSAGTAGAIGMSAVRTTEVTRRSVAISW